MIYRICTITTWLICSSSRRISHSSHGKGSFVSCLPITMRYASDLCAERQPGNSSTMILMRPPCHLRWSIYQLCEQRLESLLSQRLRLSYRLVSILDQGP